MRPPSVDESSDETDASLPTWGAESNEEPAPGTSALDDVLAELRARFGSEDAS